MVFGPKKLIELHQVTFIWFDFKSRIDKESISFFLVNFIIFIYILSLDFFYRSSGLFLD
jgi:hypothetical protein